ncbi:STAS domain-containing protein [Streptomyces sp. NPDC015139]|uniref:STAS domain-containing protein n=1 Tax=Streptomyces sp. NPDC015139 TaxID=3364942 RepID=UPI0036F77A2D
MQKPAEYHKSLITRGCLPRDGGSGPGPLPPGRLVVSYTSVGPRTRATVRGELDLNAGRQLHPALHRALTGSAEGLDLDLSRLDFCDCAGLNVLLDLRRQALRQHKTLTVSAAGPAVGRLLDLIGARELLTDPGARSGRP